MGGAVFSMNAGECIAREYNPSVANPSTAAQVSNRAKLKLASQMAAIMAPVIAIPKEGLVSSRNSWISKNYRFFDANGGIAQVTYENLQLTSGNCGIPSLSITRNVSNVVTAALSEAAGSLVSRMVYVLFKKNAEAGLQYIGSVVQNTSGTGGTFSAELGTASGEIVVYGYGMKDNNAAATAKYGNLTINNAEDIAKLVYTRTINTQDFSFTATRGTTLGSSESQSEGTQEGYARVYVTASGNGTVTGAGSFEIGSQVTVVATPSTGSTFLGWKLNGGNSYISTDASYSFTLQQQTDLIAVFYTPDAGEGDAN